VMPHAFAGLRFGYDLAGDPEVSPSRRFEAELLLRLIAIEHGAGLMVGFGMVWGN
jgi:hypothetical protein